VLELWPRWPARDDGGHYPLEGGGGQYAPGGGDGGHVRGCPAVRDPPHGIMSGGPI
jgi:hypothetical protein